MPYMGIIAPESMVSVRLLASDQNETAGTVMASLGYGQVEAGLITPVVAPGMSGEVSIGTGHGGMLRIHVEFEGGIGTGEVEVRVNGTVRDVGTATNETWWMYTVESPMHNEGGGPNGPTVFQDPRDARQTPRE